VFAGVDLPDGGIFCDAHTPCTIARLHSVDVI